MKKLSIFGSSIFISFFLNAQSASAKKNTPNQDSPKTVCSVLKSIIDNRDNDFRNIYAGNVAHEISDINKKVVPKVDGLGGEPGYIAKIRFPGAKASLISSIEKNNKFLYRYVAYFGKYESETIAVKKTEEIKDQLANCLSFNEVEARTKFQGDPFDVRTVLNKYEFQANGQEKENPKIFLLLEFGNMSSEYFVFLLFQGNSYVEKTNEPEIKKTKPVVTPPTSNQSKFTKQLRELLNYSKDGFNGIKVERTKKIIEKDDVSGDTSLILYYKPEFTLEAAKENSIKVTLPNYKNKDVSTIEFNALFGENLSMTEAENVYSNLATMIKNEFTRDCDINENKWDLSTKGDFYTKSLYVKPKNEEGHSFSLYLYPGMEKPGLGYVTTVELKVK